MNNPQSRSSAGTTPALGVLGGQGAAATAMFLSRLTQAWARASYCRDDWDQLPTVCISAALPGLGLSGLDDPDTAADALVQRGTSLLSLGAVAIALPCNSLSPLVPRVSSALGVPVWSPLEVALAEPREATQGRTWLLGSASTTRIAPEGFLLPCEQHAQQLQQIIQLVVEGRLSPALDAFRQLLRERPMPRVLLACTELSCLEHGRPLVADTMDALVRQVVSTFSESRK